MGVVGVIWPLFEGISPGSTGRGEGGTEAVLPAKQRFPDQRRRGPIFIRPTCH